MLRPRSAGAVADRDGVGDDIADNCRAAAEEGVVADPDKLMNGGEAADIDIVADLAMAAQASPPLAKVAFLPTMQSWAMWA